MNTSGNQGASAWRMVGMGTCAVLVAVLLTAPALAQEAGESTPGDLDVQLGDDTTPGVAESPTPVPDTGAGDSSSQEANTSSGDAGQNGNDNAASANATGGSDANLLAQGLIYLTGADVVWQVREVSAQDTGTAVAGNARVFVQRSGVTIMRNDITGKRARLEQGEAYFASAGDPYTAVAAEGSGSLLWIFEIANDNTVGDGALYLSPNTSGYAEAVYDFEVSRNRLDAGMSTELPGGSGPYLLMVVSGGMSVTGGDGTAALAAQEGLIVDGGGTATASGDGPATYITAMVGPTVSDASAAASAPEPTSSPPEARNADGGGGNTSSGGAGVEPSSDASNLDPGGDADNDYMTNGDELAAGLDPFDPDTDGDRLLDGQEPAGFGTDPLVKDSDGDGLIDGAEYDTYGTDPAVWDTDGDGAGDGTEVDSGTDPLDAASYP